MLTPEQEAFLSTAAAAAVKSQIDTGCPAPLTLAQAIFESAWGSRIPQNNCFGIKCHAHGPVQYVLTHEFLNGEWKEMPLAFEAYATLADCFADHARLIQTGVYEVAWCGYRASPRDASDFDTYVRAVAKLYATDPGYSDKILAEAHSATVQNAVLKAYTAAE